MKREASASSAADGELFDASSGEQEQLLSILRSVLTDQRITVSANVPNRGLVPNLPTGAIVEIPAIVTARGLRGLEVPDFADPLAAIVTRRLAPIEVMIDAALSGDPGLFAEAIILDGAVSDRVTADAMVRGFIAAQQEFLPRFG
jgi:alpha-galactosidase